MFNTATNLTAVHAGELTAPMGTNRTGVKSTGRHWMPPKISGAEAKRRISSLGMSQREIGILLGIGERQMRRYLSRDPTPVIIRLALTLLARMTPQKDTRRNRVRPYKPRPPREARELAQKAMMTAELASQAVPPAVARIEPEFHHQDVILGGAARTHGFAIQMTRRPDDD